MLLLNSFLYMTRIIASIFCVVSITSYIVINKGPSRPRVYCRIWNWEWI